MPTRGAHGRGTRVPVLGPNGLFSLPEAGHFRPPARRWAGSVIRPNHWTLRQKTNIDTGRGAGGVSPHETGIDPDLELEESTRIGEGVDLGHDETLLGNVRRRDEERDPD